MCWWGVESEKCVGGGWRVRSVLVGSGKGERWERGG